MRSVIWLAAWAAIVSLGVYLSTCRPRSNFNELARDPRCAITMLDRNAEPLCIKCGQDNGLERCYQ